MFGIKDTQEYMVISKYYEGKSANRSGVPYMNHIDEGLIVLDEIGATGIAKRAYCLHPIFQSDSELIENIDINLYSISNEVIILAIEYRSVANEYLSRRKIKSIDEIRLSPLHDVNDMLIADKVQNKKDFLIYHYDNHDRSAHLYKYFNNWLEKLGIDNDEYNELVGKIIK